MSYTEAETATVREAYLSAETDAERQSALEALSAELGKSVASLRQKLVREGVYVSKTKTETGTAKVLKSDLVAQVAQELGVEEEVVESLEKATRKTLELILEALRD